MEVDELGSTDKTAAAPAQKKAARERKAKCCLHPNEKMLTETEDGYLFVRTGKSGDVVDGVVLYRTDEAHALFHSENEKHKSAVPEQRFPQRGGY
jgi:hypothetical protein